MLSLQTKLYNSCLDDIKHDHQCTFLVKGYLITRMTVRECAESVGFDDVNYFCRVFKKETGVTPKKYAEGGN